MEKLKYSFNAKSVKELAKLLKDAHPPLSEKKFCAQITDKLDERELKGRVQLISKVMAEHLPNDPKKSLPLITSLLKSKKLPNGLEGFSAWPLTQFVEDVGINHPDLALSALKKITVVMSAEFAIRAFLLRYQDSTISLLKLWAKDENVHVRRLASEGSRPRLPWGQRIPAFQKDPQLCLDILKTLRTDPELYVRKSVANHLNDFSKDHPDWLVKELQNWKKEHPTNKNIDWIIRHACRSLVKAGHPGALAILGFKTAKVVNPRLKISPSEVKEGEKITITFSAESARKEPWLIDYAIHHRKKNGESKPKVFKWTQKSMQASQSISLEKNHRFVKMSTRKYYTGEHEVEIFVNGKSAARKSFQLK